MPWTVEPMRPGEVAGCESILRALPEWFGIESAIVDYVRDIAVMPTFVIRDGTSGRDVAGFVTINRRFPETGEIHVIAVRPDRHRAGIGRTLVRFAEEHLRDDGARLLEVKTLGASRPNDHYDRTRRFYLAMGFLRVEENPKIWDEVNPCLIMIKPLKPLV